jgi:hypothetical protein
MRALHDIVCVLCACFGAPHPCLCLARQTHPRLSRERAFFSSRGRLCPRKRHGFVFRKDLFVESRRSSSSSAVDPARMTIAGRNICRRDQNICRPSSGICICSIGLINFPRGRRHCSVLVQSLDLAGPTMSDKRFLRDDEQVGDCAVGRAPIPAPRSSPSHHCHRRRRCPPGDRHPTAEHLHLVPLQRAAVLVVRRQG